VHNLHELVTVRLTVWPQGPTQTSTTVVNTTLATHAQVAKVCHELFTFGQYQFLDPQVLQLLHTFEHAIELSAVGTVMR